MLAFRLAGEYMFSIQRGLSKLLCSVAALVLSSTRVGWPAISVGPGLPAPVTFDAVPAVSEWATQRIPGSSSDIVSAAALDIAIQTTVMASGFTNALAISSVVAPQAPAVWNSQQQNIYTGPAGIAAQLLMATLRNDSGVEIHWLSIAYDFGIGNLVGAEEVPGQRVYFSLTGELYSWQLIPDLSGRTNAGSRNVGLDVGAWPPGEFLYLLWAQDNASRSPDTCYTIDNFRASPFIVDPFSTLSIRRAGGPNVRVSWTGSGVLQSTASLLGTIQWTDIIGATSGFITNTTNGALFFRLR
jgi:hypothetical protein